jgi:hypothetical protein
MSGVAGTINIAADLRLIGAGDLGNPVAPVKVSKAIDITPGAAAFGQADILWSDQRTLAASGTENLDLAGVLTGLLGGTVTAAEITGIYLEADAGNTNDVAFFGAASNAFNGPLSGTTPKLTLGPGDPAFIGSKKGWPVTPGTGDILLVANSGGTTGVTYKIIVYGRTVAV